MKMKMNAAILAALFLIPAASPSAVQDRASTAVQPVRLEAMRNMALRTAESGFPVSLPQQWGRLVTVQRIDPASYSLFLENEAGEICIVNLIQRGSYLYLNSYDDGGVALVIRRHP